MEQTHSAIMLYCFCCFSTFDVLFRFLSVVNKDLAHLHPPFKEIPQLLSLGWLIVRLGSLVFEVLGGKGAVGDSTMGNVDHQEQLLSVLQDNSLLGQMLSCASDCN